MTPASIPLQLRRWLRSLAGAAPRRPCPGRAVRLGRDPIQRRSTLEASTPTVHRAGPGSTRGHWWREQAGCLALLACLGLLLGGAVPVQAASIPVDAPASVVFRCDGVPLTATLHGGAVDDPTIPNRSGGTLPGAFVQLQWQRDGESIALQLPRTNNAGAPSFTDGKWWWSLEDPAHPRFRLRRGGGGIEDFACEPA